MENCINKSFGSPVNDCVGGWMDGWICNGLMDGWMFSWICSSIWTHWMRPCGWGRLRQEQCCGTNWSPTPGRLWQADALDSSSAGLLFLKVNAESLAPQTKKKIKDLARNELEAPREGKTIRHRCNTLARGNVTIQRVVLWRARLPCWKSCERRRHTLAHAHLRSSFVDGRN